MRIKTGYSFRTAIGHLDEVILRIKECNYSVAPIADRNSTFGFNRWTKLAKKENLKPIYGVEIGVTANYGDKKPTLDYWTFYAINSLRPLHELILMATTGREFMLKYKEALDTPDLIKIAGERLILDEIPAGVPDLFVALSPSIPKGLYRRVNERKLQWVASSDNRYTRIEDKELYRVALGFRADVQTYPQHIMTMDEWNDSIAWFAEPDHIKQSIDNLKYIGEVCNAKMLHGKVMKPERPKPLREMCIEGAKRTGTNLNDPIYSSRLDRELKLIEEKNYEDYFYIIADMVNWAKKHMIVGPARGSSCGSLVCYLLNITAIDPIPYNLIFERFIDVNRFDLPDIDIDFSDAKRDLVFKYATDKYGKDHVARLGTTGIFRPRSALNQVGAALKIPKWMIQKVSDSVIERSGGDARALQTLEDTLKDTEMGVKLATEYPEVKIAQRMEGHPNNPSQHAAGIVITEDPITEYVAVDNRTNSVMCDKKDAEDLELLKIDALGLTQLSIFERTLELIGKPTISGWLERLPLDDQKAFDVLNQGHFAGIFQFAGSALQSLTKQIKVDNIEDIISITALARPGPLATGGANTWTNRRTGKEPVTHAHPILEQSTKESYGVVIYQEQVMNIMRNVGKLSWEDTSTLRKAMSKSMGDEFFEGFWDRFKVGAMGQGLDERTARIIWDQVNKFGSWSFNRSHAVAYGLVSYWCCWLKAHYPLEFAAATLDSEVDPFKQIQILRELKEEGIDYVPVDPDKSIDKWVPGEVGANKQRMLVGPLTQIKGIGPVYVKAIMESRRLGEPLRPGLMKKLLNAVTAIDSLYPIHDAVQDMLNGQVQSTPIPIKDVQAGKFGRYEEIVIIGVLTRIAPRNENDEQSVLKRGFKVEGPSQALNIFIRDDSDEMFAKVNRYDYERLAIQILDVGKPGKAIWALKGTVPEKFRMLSINRARYLGDLGIDMRGEEKARQGTAADSDPNTNQFKTRQGRLDLKQLEEDGKIYRGESE